MKRVSVIAIGAVVALGLSAIPVANALAAPTKHPKRPSISGAHLSVGVIGNRGGVVSIDATLSRAKHYTISSVPHLSGMPETFATTSNHQSIDVPLHIPGNRSHAPVHYVLHLSAVGPLGHAGPATLTLGVRATPTPPATPPATPPVTPPATPPTTAGPPKVLYLKATPNILDRPGGVVTITGDTYNPVDDNCVLEQVSGPAVTVDSGGFGLIPCNQPFTVIVTIPVEPAGTGGTIFTFALAPDVSGHGGGLPNAIAVIVSQYGL